MCWIQISAVFLVQLLAYYGPQLKRDICVHALFLLSHLYTQFIHLQPISYMQIAVNMFASYANKHLFCISV